ncbi:LacI family DNA-binding transcriptional regulator [Micrococcales bacterium 31B]|nr:LacI family DNA-binding transcriptional regulator [Micrococcales bacterium 31B]
MARSKRPTIYDVAERAGVSKSLVSLVLQGSPKVSDARREAVQRAIEDLDYRPSRAASTLASSGTQNIGVVIDDFRNTWYVDLLAGMREVLDDSGYHVTVADNELNSHLGQSPIDAFLAAQVEGLVIAGEPDLARERPLPVPAVVAGARIGDVPGADFVASDDRAGGVLAARHLVDLGHRRIAHLSGRGGVAALRATGYREAMRAAGLPALVYGETRDTSEASGYASTLDLLAEHPDVTAIFAANDPMAVGALAGLRRGGHAAPERVSVMGYDDSPLARMHFLALTTVDDRSHEVGREAARLLLERIGNPRKKPADLRVQPELVVRSSTGSLAD